MCWLLLQLSYIASVCQLQLQVRVSAWAKLPVLVTRRLGCSSMDSGWPVVDL
jgi:hypothetical protein